MRQDESGGSTFVRRASSRLRIGLLLETEDGIAAQAVEIVGEYQTVCFRFMAIFIVMGVFNRLRS